MEKLFGSFALVLGVCFFAFAESLREQCCIERTVETADSDDEDSERIEKTEQPKKIKQIIDTLSQENNVKTNTFNTEKSRLK